MAQKPSYEELEKDVFKLRGVEDALRQNEEKFRLLYERIPLGYQSLDENGNFIEVNQTWLDTLGYTREEVIGKSFGDFLHPEWVDHFKENFPRFKAIGEILGVEFEMVKKDGSFILVSINGKIGKDEKGNFKQTHCILHDITSQKKSEEALRESEERLKSFYRAAFEGLAISEQGKLIDFNRQFADMLGYERDELIGKEVIDLVADEDRELVLGNIRSDFYRPYEHKALHKDGSILNIEVHGQQIQFQGRPARVTAIHDLSERRRAEEALRESEEKLTAFMESATDGFILFDSDLNHIAMNKVALEITGLERKDVIGKNVIDTVPNIKESGRYDEYKKVMKTGLPFHITDITSHPLTGDKHIELKAFKSGDGLGIIFTNITERKQAEEALRKSEERYRALFEDSPIETIVVDKDAHIKMYNKAKRTSGDRLPSIGDVMYKDYAASHLIDMHRELMECIQLKKSKEFPGQNYQGRFLDIRLFPFEEGAIITAIDQTEKKNLEAKLQRTQKMESLGLMAGGIAHDLNNILSGIVSYPELLLMDLPEDSKLRRPIETIKESGMRAADVVSDLLTVARGVATGQEVLNLNTIIEECLSSAEHQELKIAHSLITFKADLAFDLLNINCSSTHIKKSLTNLITNASEAVEGSGTVIISTENRYLDEPLKGYEDVRRGEYAVLTVSDNGSGISADDLERIFEPFYTKKVMGRSGTGLGLAVVWNTVQDHDGYINVKTGKKGTAFELYFPVTRDEVAIEGDAVPVDDYLGNGEKVLVVDDEKSQREIACGILTKLGYNAEAASSGEEAVEYLKEQSVDLIVLDMIMPKGINGRETYERIIKIHPGQKAIIASGYAETPDVKKAQKLGAGKYIKKPYRMDKIGLAVKEELEK